MNPCDVRTTVSRRGSLREVIEDEDLSRISYLGPGSCLLGLGLGLSLTPPLINVLPHATTPKQIWREEKKKNHGLSPDLHFVLLLLVLFDRSPIHLQHPASNVTRRT
jgi:hypothetical protein